MSCPKGEEWILLRQNEQLVNPELVEVMEQVANQMAAEGDADTASFLGNLATDLNRTWLEHHEFKPTLKKEIAPDPWLEEDTPSPPAESTKETEAIPLESTEPQAEPETVLTSPETTPQTEPQLSQQLHAIANSLVKLEDYHQQIPSGIWIFSKKPKLLNGS